jgi:hypothetical protein
MGYNLVTANHREAGRLNGFRLREYLFQHQVERPAIPVVTVHFLVTRKAIGAIATRGYEPYGTGTVCFVSYGGLFMPVILGGA